jgi:hypothetical protein
MTSQEVFSVDSSSQFEALADSPSTSAFIATSSSTSFPFSVTASLEDNFIIITKDPVAIARARNILEVYH